MKAAFLFSGQGAQQPGMGKDLCEAYEPARRVFEEANDTLGRDIQALTFDGTAEELNLTANTQPCLLTMEVAAMAALSAEGIKPDATAGFSLGEWAAVVTAGCLPFAEGLRLVELRAKAMQEAAPVGLGAMAAIMGQDGPAVEALCKRAGGYVVPSNYNCPGQITVAGQTEAVDALLEVCATEGIVAQKLSVSIPSHCILMKPAARQLESALQRAHLQAPRIPLVMNATGMAAKDAVSVKENLIQQLTYPVQFETSLRVMLADGVDTFIEVGPGKTLSGFAKRTAKSTQQHARCLRASDMPSLMETISVL